MIIPFGYAQANFIMSGNAAPTGAQFTLGFDVGSYGGSPADAAEIIWGTFDASDIPAYVSDEITFQEVLVKYGPSSTGPSGTWVAAAPGEGTGAAVAPNTSWLVRKETALGGHAGKGRLYLPGISESIVDEAGVITTPFPANLSLEFDTWAASLILADLVPVLLHAEGSPISTPTPITSFVVDGRVATQRRRLRR